MSEKIPQIRNLVRTKRPISPWAVGFIFIFFLGMFIVLFLRSPFTNMKEVVILGTHQLTKKEIQKQIGYYPGISYFRIHSKEAKKKLLLLPEVKKVEVHKGFPNKIYITIEEKPVVAAIEWEHQLFPLLSDGTILLRRPYHTSSLSIPMCVGWTNRKEDILLVSKELSLLSNSIKNELLIIKPVDKYPDQIEILTKRKHQIFIRIGELSKKVYIYSSFMNHPPGKLYLLDGTWFKPDS